MRIRAIAVLSILAFASIAWAQSLGEIAAQEKKRRKGTTHVITERDLARARGKSYSQPQGPTTSETSEETTAAETSETAGGASESAPTEEEQPKTEEEIRAEKFTDWQARIKQAREKVERLDQQATQLQLQANDMTVSQFGPARARLLERLEKAKQELAAARQELASLEDERRRSGYRR